MLLFQSNQNKITTLQNMTENTNREIFNMVRDSAVVYSLIVTN